MRKDRELLFGQPRLEEPRRRAAPRLYAALRDLRDRHQRELREGMPHLPRRVSGYNLDALLPEHGFNVAHA